MDNQPVLPPGSGDKTAISVTDQQKNTVLLVYILQALGFVIGVTPIAGVVINYLKRDEVSGTYLESHVTWQIKTFWYALLGYFISLVLFIVLIGWLLMMVVTVWYIYRVIKGWLALNDGKELPDAFF